MSWLTLNAKTTVILVCVWHAMRVMFFQGMVNATIQELLWLSFLIADSMIKEASVANVRIVTF